MVVAETLDAALDAAELVAVEYDPVPSVTNTEDALAAKAVLWPEAPDNVAWIWQKGADEALEAAVRAAAHVTRLYFVVTRYRANPIEPRTALGDFRDGRMVLYASNQSPYQLRAGLAGLFKAPPEQVRVIAGDVGGSFGMKAGAEAAGPASSLGGRGAGRPVRGARRAASLRLATTMRATR